MERRDLGSSDPLDLFDGGTLPLGRLLDPGSGALRTNRAKTASIVAKAPATWGLAAEMAAQLALRWQWLRPGRDGEWYTETANAARLVGRGEGGKERWWRGRSLQERDVALHLLGLTAAIGATDRPIGGNHDAQRAGLSLANLVPALRIDVDMPFAWTIRERGEIVDEIRAEARLLTSFGLQARAFRTGGKGHQLAVALPSPVPHSVASLVARAVRIDAQRRGAKGVDVDKDNVSAHVRLPGGVHARTGRVGLWIDHALGRLHEDGAQAEMMTSSYRWDPESAGWAEGDWEREVAALTSLLRRRYGWDPHRVLGDEEAERALRELPAESALCDGLHLAMSRSGRSRKVTVPLPHPVPAAPSVPVQKGDRRRSLEWAQRTWSVPPVPGAFYGWLSMESGGGKGLLAAAILYGPDRGKDELLRLACSVAGSPADVAQRVATIESYWPGFHGRHARAFVPKPKPAPVIVAASEDAILAARHVAESMQRPSIARWRREDAEAVVLELLVAIVDSEEACAAIGSREIATRIERRAGSSPSHRRVADMVERLVEGTEACVVRAFRRRERVATVAAATTLDGAGRRRGWVGEGAPAEYVVGPALASLPIGEELAARRERHLARLYGD